MHVAFQHITGGPGGERLEDLVGIFKHRDHEKLGVRALRFEFSNKLNAGDARQLDVDDDRIRGLGEDGIERGFGTDVAADDDPGVGRGEDFQKRFPELGIVLDNGDAAGGGLHGTSTTVLNLRRVDSAKSPGCPDRAPIGSCKSR